MRNLRRLAAAFAAMLTLGAGAALAQDKITIATEGAYPPFNNVTADGQLVGFDVDIANALCAEIKAECKLVTQDWDGMIPALMAGKFDVIVASMTITEERKKQISFTHKYYATPLSLVVPKDSAIASTEAAALAGKTLGAQGATTQSMFAEDVYVKAGAELKLYPTQDEAMSDILNGRLDAVIADKFVLLDWLKSTGSDCCKLVGDIAGTDSEAGIALRKDEDALRQKLDAALDAIRANGTYAKIEAKYFDFDIYGK